MLIPDANKTIHINDIFTSNLDLQNFLIKHKIIQI